MGSDDVNHVSQVRMERELEWVIVVVKMHRGTSPDLGRTGTRPYTKLEKTGRGADFKK